MGGLVALSRGECHLAGSHLLDPESGEYNLKYVQANIAKLTDQNHCIGWANTGIDGRRGESKTDIFFAGSYQR